MGLTSHSLITRSAAPSAGRAVRILQLKDIDAGQKRDAKQLLLMNITDLKRRFPDIEIEQLYPYFPRLDLSETLKSNGYSWEACHHGFLGAGGLLLVEELAQAMALRPGMRLLDLACGRCASSIFLAQHYDLNVVAVDNAVDPVENLRRVDAAGMKGKVTPVSMDARDLHFSQEQFDAIFCMNSYFYFGTGERYLDHLTQFMRIGAVIGIATPCYAHEIGPDTDEDFLYDAPDFTESFAVHSPTWWQSHFERTGLVELLICEENPRGRELWLDDVRWLLEKCHPRDMEPDMQAMVRQQIVMLLKDQSRFVTYLTLVARKLGH